MERIVFLDRATMGADIELEQPKFEHEWVAHEATFPDQTAERLAGCSIAITNKVPIGEDELAVAPDLKMIMVAATGYDVIDIEACRRRGVIVSNVRGYGVHSVPEHVFSLVFALSRGLLAYREDVLAGEWERSGQFCFFAEPIRDVAGGTLGIVGAGQLGQAVGRLGAALGMTCLYTDREGGPDVGQPYTPFDELLARSDVVTLHCPLREGTRDLIARPAFERMERKPLLINCGRGGIVNEADLVTALDEGLISGAGIDCVLGEPPPADSPIHRIKGRRNVIVTPHVAWASQSARTTLWHQLIDCLESFVAGRPKNEVTGAVA